MATMNDASDMVVFFKIQQKKHGFTEPEFGNIIQQRFNMRDIMNDIPEKDMEKLVIFYIRYDDDKSLSNFFRRYNEYYQSFVEVRRDRRRRKALLKKTMERVSEQQ